MTGESVGGAVAADFLESVSRYVTRDLTLEDGTELDDDGEVNVALFVAEHDTAPASVTIYDTDGQPLTTHNP